MNADYKLQDTLRDRPLISFGLIWLVENIFIEMDIHGR